MKAQMIKISKNSPRKSTSLIIPKREGLSIILPNEFQREVFELPESRITVINAFMGSGKAPACIGLAIKDIVRHSRKQLVVVPQRIIAYGFGPQALQLDGTTYRWHAGVNNFCDNHPQTLEGLERWMLTPAETLNEKWRHYPSDITFMSAVATHQALALVWAKLKREGRTEEALQNLTGHIDEAHHIDGIYSSESNVSDTERTFFEFEGTILGDFCRGLLNSKDRRLLLYTATFFRGDKNGILYDTDATVYEYPLSRQWPNLDIREFRQMFEEYRDTPDLFDCICRNIANEPNEYHLIVFPSTTRRFRQTPDTEISAMKERLGQIHPANSILDLICMTATGQINKTLQDKNTEEILKNPEKYKIVLTCMKGREGMNWLPCSRIHHTAVEGSLTLAVQTVGRPFRDYLYEDGRIKEGIQVVYYVPVLEGDDVEKRITDRLNSILVASEMVAAFLPQVELPSGRTESKTKGGSAVRGRDLFDEYQKMIPELLLNFSYSDSPNAQRRLLDEYADTYLRDEFEDCRELAIEHLKKIVLAGAGVDVDTLIDVSFLHGLFDKMVASVKDNGCRMFGMCTTPTDLLILREYLQDETWNRMLESVCAVDNNKQRHGLHTASYTKEQLKWMEEQRRKYEAETMPDYQKTKYMSRLGHLLPDWVKR